MNIPAPMCAVCRKFVSHFYANTHGTTGDLTLTATCHGKTEQTVLTRDEVSRLMAIRTTMAFAAEAAERDQREGRRPGPQWNGESWQS